MDSHARMTQVYDPMTGFRTGFGFFQLLLAASPSGFWKPGKELVFRAIIYITDDNGIDIGRHTPDFRFLGVVDLGLPVRHVAFSSPIMLPEDGENGDASGRNRAFRTFRGIQCHYLRQPR